MTQSTDASFLISFSGEQCVSLVLSPFLSQDAVDGLAVPWHLGLLSPSTSSGFGSLPHSLMQPRMRSGVTNQARSDWDGRAPGGLQDTMEVVIGDHIAGLLP